MRRKRAERELTVRPRPASLSASLPLTSADCKTGIAPNSSAVTSVVPSANHRTGASIGIASTLGILRFATPLGKIASRKCVHHTARSTPNPPPSSEKRKPSLRNCCRRRHRLPPSAIRTETSVRRLAARASNKPAMFTHAMNKTSATAPDSASSGPRMSPAS
jgi:hypothetical protein